MRLKLVTIYSVTCGKFLSAKFAYLDYMLQGINFSDAFVCSELYEDLKKGQQPAHDCEFC
jgi:hypothetical protein